MIEFKNLKKRLDNFEIDLNFKINEGEIFGIIGETGSGKTTILKLLQNLIKADSGTLIIPQNYTISTVFQEFNLLNNLTVFENVNLSLKIKGIKDNQLVINSLSFVELLEKKDIYPVNISGGQKQRVAIARAITPIPNLLLCDEPTASLDKNTSKEIVNIFLNINKKYKTTIVCVTHELDIAKALCDRIAVIKNGKIINIINNNKEEITIKNNSYYEHIEEVFNCKNL